MFNLGFGAEGETLLPKEPWPAGYAALAIDPDYAPALLTFGTCDLPANNLQQLRSRRATAVRATAAGRAFQRTPAASPAPAASLSRSCPSLDLVVTRQTGSSGEWEFEEYLRRACAAVLPQQAGRSAHYQAIRCVPPRS